MARTLWRAAALTLVAAAGPAAADEVVEKLNAVPGLTILQEKPTPWGGRFFVLGFEQPVDHLKPWKGTFRQRLTLYHESFAEPIVFYSGGYGIGTNPRRTEVTQILESNQLVVEHRFFPASRPDPPDWSDLSIFQQASDDHRLVQALRPLYAGRWLRSGASKGGMQATYHTRFHPGDTDGLVAYVAPNDAIDTHDRYQRFLDEVGDDPQCREDLKTLQREILLRRDAILPMIVAQVGPHAFDQIIGSPEKALELLVTELPFTFWQFATPGFDCAFVPPAGAPTEDLFLFLDSWATFLFYTDDFVEETYFFQAGTQLGYPRVADAHIRDLLLFPGADVPRSFVRPELQAEMGPFQWWAMLDVDLFVRFLGRRQLFIYGETDPWGAERFEPGPFAADSYVYTAPDMHHGANVATLAPADRDAAIATIRRWAGLPPLAARDLVALRGRLAQEPALDYVERMTRRGRPLAR
jgi:PS-10 peptidase S37